MDVKHLMPASGFSQRGPNQLHGDREPRFSIKEGPALNQGSYVAMLDESLRQRQTHTHVLSPSTGVSPGRTFSLVWAHGLVSV